LTGLPSTVIVAAKAEVPEAMTAPSKLVIRRDRFERFL